MLFLRSLGFGADTERQAIWIDSSSAPTSDAEKLSSAHNPTHTSVIEAHLVSERCHELY